MEVPVFVLTGGDPLKRPDIFELVQYATERSVRISLTPSATPLLTRDSIVRLKDRRIWLDSPFRLTVPPPPSTMPFAVCRAPTSGRSTQYAGRAKSGLPVQINTTITRHNLAMLDDIIALLESLDITLWSVFFLVPTGRGSDIDLISAEEFEQVFDKLYHTSQRVLFDIKSTEAQHYRRYLLQRRTEARRLGQSSRPRPSRAFRSSRRCRMGMETPDGIGRAPRGINDGKGFVFISHVGEVYPSGFLPLSGGNVRKQSLADIYRNSPLFRSLRDSKNLEGKCGACEYREICGGSRARSYAMTGNLFAEEPCCVLRAEGRTPALVDPAYLGSL